MLQIHFETIRESQWPEFYKSPGATVFVYNPYGRVESVRKAEKNFFIPYYHVTVEDIQEWFVAMKGRTLFATYKGILMEYTERGSSSRFGGALVEVISLDS